MDNVRNCFVILIHHRYKLTNIINELELKQRRNVFPVRYG
jgi:hypothetical protein